MKKSLMNKFTLKILSLLIAILIWLLVMNIETPSITQTYTDIPVTFVNEAYIAVSYTHLDVYKRQGMRCMAY